MNLVENQALKIHCNTKIPPIHHSYGKRDEGKILGITWVLSDCELIWFDINQRRLIPRDALMCYLNVNRNFWNWIHTLFLLQTMPPIVVSIIFVMCSCEYTCLLITSLQWLQDFLSWRQKSLLWTIRNYNACISLSLDPISPMLPASEVYFLHVGARVVLMKLQDGLYLCHSNSFPS
jgi:hypothetical protein